MNDVGRYTPGVTLARFLPLAALSVSLAAAAAGPGAVPGKGWTADPAVVERFQKRRPNFIFEESKVPPYELPDALRFADGRAVTTPRQWRERRAEILESFRSQMFGRAPAKPQQLSFDVVEENRSAMDGSATFKRVAIISRHEGRGHRFEMLLFLPNARKTPAPVFLLLNNRDPAKNTDATRQVKSEFWPAEQIVARGYGTAVIQNNDLAPDVKAGTTFRDGVIRLFEGGRDDRPADAWMAIAAWAWGASRALDYLETDAGVDAARVAVVGHSRGGKTALWAAAEDERFAMAVSNNSGSCGAAISRRRFGETIALTHTNPHWFCDNFKRYHDREDELPFDQHMLLGLIAPRALYVTSATEDLSADPRGEYLALAHASSVYALLRGHPPIAPGDMPPADTPIRSGPRGYHIRSGPHDLTSYDWKNFCDFADAVWR